MEPWERFFERKLETVWNSYSFELIPQVGFKKKFRLGNFKNAKKAPTLFNSTAENNVFLKLMVNPIQKIRIGYKNRDPG